MLFNKYCASGNDFLIFNAFQKKDYSQLAIKYCDRQYGFGADGLIVIVPNNQYDYEWLFYNSDGNMAEMCGNGARAAALYAYNENVASQTQQFLTLAGMISARIYDDSQVEITLTDPRTIAQNINGYKKIDTGVPHMVKELSNIDEFDLNEAQQMRIENNSNISVYQITKDCVLVRSYERGVEGETLACGTGMAACIWSIIEEQHLSKCTFQVKPKSGETLHIGFDGLKLTFRGKVSFVGRCLT